MRTRNINADERHSPEQILKHFFVQICIACTVTLLIFAVIFSLSQIPSFREAAGYFWQIFAVSCVGAVLQGLFFTDLVIKRLSYPLRLVFFGICMYIAVLSFALSLKWFPAGLPWAWVGFTLIYLLIFGVLSVVFTLVFSRQEKALQRGLEDYKSKHQDKMD